MADIISMTHGGGTYRPPQEEGEERKPWLPMIWKERPDYERDAIMRYERGEPLKPWEYRPKQETESVPWWRRWLDLSRIVSPVGATPYTYPAYYTQAEPTDLELWAIEEAKQGLQRWWDDTVEMFQDTRETVQTQYEAKTGWRKVVEPIKHGLMGLAGQGLFRFVGPAFGQAGYLVERAIGRIARTKPAPLEPFDPDKYESWEQWIETAPSQSIDEWLDEEYGHDPDLRKKAEEIARDVDRISFSWVFGVDPGPEGRARGHEEFKQIHRKLMQAEDDDEREKILKQHQKFIPELVFGFVLDPLNIVSWTGKTPIATSRARKIVHAASQPLDEVLDFQTAAYRITGVGRTPAARARKVGETVHDFLVFQLKRAHSVDDLPRVIREFMEDSRYNSTYGQLVKRVLENIPEEQLFDGVHSTQTVREALEVVATNASKVARAEEMRYLRNTRWGRVLDDFSRWAEKWSRMQKKVLSPLFLGWNPQYAIANWFDNMRNILTRIGWQRIPGGSFTDNLALNARAAEKFFSDMVGAIPQRLKTGFTVTMAEVGVEDANRVKTVWKTVWDTIKGPFLKAAGSIEERASAFAITQSYIKRWPRIWSQAMPQLPDELADAIRAASPERGEELVEAINSVGIGKYGYRAVLDELKAIEQAVVEGAEVEGRVIGIGWYLRQLTKPEREAILAHPDILDEVQKLSGVTSEAERRGIINNLRRMITEGAEEVAKEKHFRDLQFVGWGHHKAKILRAVESVTQRFARHPLVREVMTSDSHDFDLLRRVAAVYGVDVADLCEPMDDVVFKMIQAGEPPRKLWEYYQKTYPFMRKFYPRFTDDIGEQVLQDGVMEAMHQLTHFDEITPIKAKDAFFEIYKKLLPKGRQKLVKDIPEVDTLRIPPSLIDDAGALEILKKVQQWVKDNPQYVVSPEDYDDLQHAVQLAKRYMLYKENMDEWVEWANSSWKIDRLPENIPNLYDIVRLYKTHLESAIEKLDQRTFKALNPSMDIPPSLWNKIVDWFDTEFQKAMDLAQYTTARLALADRDFAILDYLDRTILDVFLGLGIPYEYWAVHNIWNWLLYIVDHPRVMSWLNRYQAVMEAQLEKDPLVPRRLKGWFPIGIQGMYKFLTDQAWSADTELYFAPMRILFPLETMPMWGKTYLPDNYMDITRGREWVFINNMWSTSPILFDSVALLANAVLPWAEEHQPTLARYIKRYIPPMAMKTGTAYWSATRGIRGLSILGESILKRMGIDVPPEGLNPEGTIHDWLGLGRIQPTETYWRYQWIANLLGSGEITEEEAIQALREQKGRAWDLAVRRAAEQVAIPSAIRWGTYMPFKIYPSEERILRGQGQIYKKYYERYEQGDRDALKEFYEIYPEYRFRQLAFRYWDVAKGEISEEEWQEWVDLNLKVNEYYQKRGELERQRQDALQRFPIGSPEHYRTIQEFSRRRQELNEAYEDVLTEYFDVLADNRKKFIQWRDGPKAKAMREFLDRWYKADPEQKERMLENLPQTMLEVAASVRADEEPRLFTALDIRRELVRRDTPVDAVYRELNNQVAKVWDKFYQTDWWEENTTQEVQDLYAVYRDLDFPSNQEFREAHPELDKALNDYQQWRDDLLNTVLDPTSPDFIAAITVLHPDWGEDKIAELKRIGKQIGAFAARDYTYIRGSDRDMVISELWRFWETLPEKSLARRMAKDVLGPRFAELFLAGEYNQISDEELALWLNLLPDDWTSLIPEGRRPPFGTGPVPMTEQELLFAARRLTQEEWDEMVQGGWIPPEPEDREAYRFAPTARPETGLTEEEARKEAQEALERAREQLRAGEAPEKIVLPSPAEEQEYQRAYELLQRALNGESDLWEHELVEKWFPPNTPSRRFWKLWYDCVPPGELGKWAREHPLVSAILDKVSRKYITDDAYTAAMEFLIEELPKHDIGDPREYEQARTEAEEYFALMTPELEALRDAYFQIPQGARCEGMSCRRKFLEEHPELLALFDAQNKFKAEHPIFTKYYDPDWVQRQEKYAQRTDGGRYRGSAYTGKGFYRGSPMSQVTWRGLVHSLGPLVMGELIEHWASNRPLSAAARRHLRRVWEASGTDLSFDDWLDYIRRLWVRFGATGFKQPTTPRVNIPPVLGGPYVTGRARWRIRR